METNPRQLHELKLYSARMHACPPRLYITTRNNNDNKNQTRSRTGIADLQRAKMTPNAHTAPGRCGQRACKYHRSLGTNDKMCIYVTNGRAYMHFLAPRPELNRRATRENDNTISLNVAGCDDMTHHTRCGSMCIQGTLRRASMHIPRVHFGQQGGKKRGF